MKVEEIKASKHLFDILDAVLNYTAMDVKLNNNGTIDLFFDGCCKCTIKIEKYIDLRAKESEDTE